MIIDTNSISQVAQTVTAVQTSFNWPALAAAALWIRADLYKGADWIMSHGGIGYLLLKLVWNPPAVPK